MSLIRRIGVRAYKLVPYRVNGALGLLFGLWGYYRKGQISHQSWDRLLRAHCSSNGRFTEYLKTIIAAVRPQRTPVSATGLLGTFSVAKQVEIVEAIQRDGFYRFDNLMPPEICDQIERFAARTPAEPDNAEGVSLPLVVYDPSRPLARVYKIPERASIGQPGIQHLMADEAFIAISEMYLKSHPAIGGVDVWWSARFGNAPASSAAQLFHFDFDAPPAWLKLFVYVTDVGPDNGPHVYVKGSHRSDVAAAKALRARGYVRISDEEITAAFGEDALVSFTGPRGTAFLVDTRGFHKGTLPTAGHRLIAQLIYCSPVFSEHGTHQSLPEIVIPELKASVEKSPRVYERFL